MHQLRHILYLAAIQFCLIEYMNTLRLFIRLRGKHIIDRSTYFIHTLKHMWLDYSITSVLNNAHLDIAQSFVYFCMDE